MAPLDDLDQLAATLSGTARHAGDRRRRTSLSSPRVGERAAARSSTTTPRASSSRASPTRPRAATCPTGRERGVAAAAAPARAPPVVVAGARPPVVVRLRPWWRQRRLRRARRSRASLHWPSGRQGCADRSWPSTSGATTIKYCVMSQRRRAARGAAAAPDALPVHPGAPGRGGDRAIDEGDWHRWSASASPASSPTATSCGRATSSRPGGIGDRGRPRAHGRSGSGSAPGRAARGDGPRRPGGQRRDPRGDGLLRGRGVELVVTLGTGVGLAMQRDGDGPGPRRRPAPFLDGRTYDQTSASARAPRTPTAGSTSSTRRCAGSPTSSARG